MTIQAIGNRCKRALLALAMLWPMLVGAQNIPPAADMHEMPYQYGKRVAYIMVGNLNFGDMTCSFWENYRGLWGEPGYGDPQRWIAPIVMDRSRYLGYYGYEVRFIPVATVADLQRALVQPETGALVWIGHAQPHQFTDANGVAIGQFNIRDWAITALRQKGAVPIEQPWQALSPLDRGLKAQMEDRAHFDLLYFYQWGCNAMDDPNNNPGLRMLRDGGVMEGTTGYQVAAPHMLLAPDPRPTFRKRVFWNAPSVHQAPSIQTQGAYQPPVFAPSPSLAPPIVAQPRTPTPVLPAPQQQLLPSPSFSPTPSGAAAGASSWYVWYLDNVALKPVQLGDYARFSNNSPEEYPGAGPRAIVMRKIPLVQGARTRQEAITAACREFTNFRRAGQTWVHTTWLGDRLAVC